MPFVARLIVRNYRSIAHCDLVLQRLSFLVGPNGSGKSNLLDSLRFVSDALQTSLDHALRERGGINEVRRRSGGHPTHFGVHLFFNLGEGGGEYSFRIAARERGRYEVQDEMCRFQPRLLHEWHTFHVKGGEVETSVGTAVPSAQPDRLYLVNASGLDEFRPVYDHLSSMGFYNLNPDDVRALQRPDPGDLLTRTGKNLPSVLEQLARNAPESKARIEEFLSKVVVGLRGVDRVSVGPMETLQFKQEVQGSPHPWRFPAGSMSDGTLRALGILVALFQTSNGFRHRIPLVGIEEPEVALHPAAAGILLDALRLASRRTQVVVTSHSPELLDDDEINSDSIFAVLAEKGETKIGPVDEASRKILRDGLFTAGELLRLNQLRPDLEEARRRGQQFSLFADE